jgi:hypothetical protein
VYNPAINAGGAVRRPFILSVIVVLVLTALNFWSWRKLEEERAHNAELQIQLQQLHQARAAAREPARMAGQFAPKTLSQPPGNPPTSATSAAKATPAASKYEDWAARERRLMSDPKYREARKAELKMGWSRFRQDGMHVLGATAAEADTVVEWLVETQLAQSIRSNPRTPEEVAQRRLEIEQSKSREDAELRELLGDSKAEQWQQFMASQASRMVVSQLRAQLTSSDPLRDEQVEPLIAALHAERTQFDDEMRAYRDSLSSKGTLGDHGGALYLQREIERAAAANERAHATVAAILSPSQLDKLDELNNRKLETLRVQLQISVAAAEARQRSTGAN